MRVLLVNNHSKHLKKLITEVIHEHKNVKVCDFKKIKKNSFEIFDRIILSGGSSESVVGHADDYAAEIDLIKKAKVPVLGICLGFELINFTFGEKLYRQKKVKGKFNIKLISRCKLFKDLPTNILVYEAHRWVVKKTNFLKTLASSNAGIEAVRHPKKKIFAVQFHPEVLVDKGLAKKVIQNFLLANFN